MELVRLLAGPNQHHKRTITADSQNSVVNERGGLAAGFGQIPRYGAVPVEKLWTLCRRRIFHTGNKQTQRIAGGCRQIDNACVRHRLVLMTGREFGFLRDQRGWIKHIDSRKPAALGVIPVLEFVQRAPTRGHRKARQNISGHFPFLAGEFLHFWRINLRPFAILNEKASALQRKQRIRVSRVAPGTLALYAARNRIQQNAMKHHLAARSAPAPRKPRLIVLTVERNSEGSVIEKCHLILQESVGTEIPLGDRVQIPKLVQIERQNGLGGLIAKTNWIPQKA